MKRPVNHRAIVAALGALSLIALFFHVGAATADPLSAPQNAFSHPFAGLDTARHAHFDYGRGLFHYERSPITHADLSMSGLGPLFNARACGSCHIGDGRGHPPLPGQSEAATSFILMLATPDGPDPIYGAQLQDQGAGEIMPEGRPVISYRETQVALAGGETASLRTPNYAVADLAYGPLDPATGLGPRIAPPMIGLGLLDLITDAQILANQDPTDKNHDNIAGIANFVRDPDSGTMRIGRFGWKASSPTIAAQVRIAAVNDMGLSLPGRPAPSGDCTVAEAQCLAIARPASGRPLELDPNDARLLAFYAAHLEVPPRRNIEDPVVTDGERLFAQIGCGGCHVPVLATIGPDQGFYSGMPVAAYSDLLLHDMGEGLGDDLTMGMAGPNQWRTQPLWGIGLTSIVSNGTFFLHDGRARNLTEAILWHGGEGTTARDRFKALDPAARSNLLAFLNSL